MASTYPAARRHPLGADLDFILEETDPLWSELQGQRLFITGGTGFIGSWLLESLVWANEHLGAGITATLLTRKPDRFRSSVPHIAGNPAISLHAGDVRDFSFPAGEFPMLIHAAATNAAETFRNEDPMTKFDTLAKGARRTMEFAATCGARRVLLMGSGAMYGKQPSDVTHLPEDYTGAPSPVDPVAAALGEGKRAAEFFATYYGRRYGFDVKIVRLFSFVGPYLPMDIHYAIGNFIRDGMSGGPIVINGDGTAHRSYLYIADLIVWLWTILLRGEAFCPYNVGSEDSLTIRELAETVAGRFTPAVAIHVKRDPVPGVPLDRYVPTTARVRAALGVRQAISLTSALDRTIAYAAARSMPDA